MLLETSLARNIFDLHVPVFRIILMTSQASYPIQIPQIYNSVKQKKKDKKCNTAPSIMKEKSSNIKSKRRIAVRMFVLKTFDLLLRNITGHV